MVDKVNTEGNGRSSVNNELNQQGGATRVTKQMCQRHNRDRAEQATKP